MYGYKSRKGLAWQRKERFKSQYSNMTVDTDFENFGTLKKEVKRIEIMSRMENRAQTNVNRNSNIRPATESNRRSEKPKPTDFKRVEKEFLK